MSNPNVVPPKISLIVLNYNGLGWLPRCFASLEAQTIVADVEVIVVDNNSPDGSVRLAAEWVQREPSRRKLVANAENLFFCEANNVGARVATGKYLFFLNNDLWLEPDCLEKLLRGTEQAQADASMPLVCDYEDDSFQNLGAPGMDWFGLSGDFRAPYADTREIFAACGCSYLIAAELFARVGGFDAKFLMYTDEVDLSWRVQMAGGRIVAVPAARLHHRGAATANPEGQTRIVESRTSESKRFLANRNGVLMILKNAQHLLGLLLVTQGLLLLAEAMVGLLLVRRWSYVRKCYWDAVVAAFRMRDHVSACRRQARTFRVHGDLWMLRFICLKPSRWGEVQRLFGQGVPRIDAK